MNNYNKETQKALKILNKALTKFSRAEIAVALGMSDAQRVTSWLYMGKIPAKHFAKIAKLEFLESVNAVYSK